MPENKTKPTGRDVRAFLDGVENERLRADCFALLEMMREVTGEEPYMWGDTIVGFGNYHYKYASGHEGDAPVTGFAPRKPKISVYITAGFEAAEPLFARLGKHTMGKSCLYINRLADVDADVLKQIVRRSVAQVRATYPD